MKKNASTLWQTSEDQIRSVDGLRALSFIWIFIFHIFYLYESFISPELQSSFIDSTKDMLFAWRGTLGVDTFFVISGFLIARLLIKEYEIKKSIDLKRFYLRRFLRLMPVYYFSIFVVVIGYDPKISANFALNGEQLWANLLYVNNFFTYHDQFMLWTWSLAIEEQFYILFALMASVVFVNYRRGVGIVTSLIILSFLIRWYYVDASFANAPVNPLLLDTDLLYFDTIYDKLHGRFGAIFIGILVALISYKYPLKAKKTSYLIIVQALSVLGLIALLYYNPAEIPAWYLISFRNIFSIFIAIILFVQLNLDGKFLWFMSPLKYRIFKPIAQVSYGAYIWHPICISVVYGLTLKRGLLVNSIADLTLPAIVAFAITIMVSMLTYLLIEKPLMNMRKYL